MYLVLEVGDSQLSAPKPWYGSLGLQLNSFWCMFTGLSPSVAGHFSLTNEEAAGPLTLHLPQVSLRDSVWTVPGSLAATKGIPCLVSFPPPTKMLPFGGFPLREGATDSCEFAEKSHSGILGSKAACAYPRRYRGLPRPSSALKPSHPPDSVACFGPMVVSVWRLVKHIFHCIVCCVVVDWPMHGVIVNSQ